LIANIAEFPVEGDSRRSCARLTIRASADSKDKIPEIQAAENSPRLCPNTAEGYAELHNKNSSLIIKDFGVGEEFGISPEIGQ